MLVGIASSGVHSNGFSLVRKIVADNKLDLNGKYEETGDRTLGEMLLTPTRIYVKQVHNVLKEVDVHGIAHITGGGFDENIPRILGEGQGCGSDRRQLGDSSGVPSFGEIWQSASSRDVQHLQHGHRMVLAVNEADAPKVVDILSKAGEKASVIGKVVEGNGVTIK